MAFRKLRRTRETEIPTSSMADIAFLLIIFFMLTAVFTSNRGLQFEYPENDPTEEVQPEEAIHIKIEGESQFEVDRNTLNSLELVGGYVQSKMEQNPEKPVIIESLPDVPYFVMIDVFDLLKSLNVKNIAIPTKSERKLWDQFLR